MVLQCTEGEKDNIIRKLKGKTTQLYKQHRGITKEYHLRAQKYNAREIRDEKYFYNAMEYVEHNREKHGLSAGYANPPSGGQGVSTPCSNDISIG